MGDAEIHLNGRELGRTEARRDEWNCDITESLRERNRLEIIVTSLTGTGGIPGEVVLEIRCLAWLHRCEVETWRVGDEGYLRVRGEVVGQAEGPLDIYAVLGRFVVAQGKVEAAPQGQRFSLTSDPLPPERWRGELSVRVELVHGPSVWYVLESSAEFGVRKGTP
jgi:hypothetical protein